ncbi:MAG: hypothetical protein JWM25_1079 [Thermoleophilia bacterium]|nr:hypothetical protein [Thermoleophilia bacterium]
MNRPTQRKGSFIERVLDGVTRLDQLETEVAAWGAGAQAQPLHEALGLDAAELLLVARSPDALRYVLHARRFGLALSAPLDSQDRVRAYATMLAAEAIDPQELAAIDSWQRTIARRPEHEPTHA